MGKEKRKGGGKESDGEKEAEKEDEQAEEEKRNGNPPKELAAEGRRDGPMGVTRLVPLLLLLLLPPLFP